MPDQMTVEQKEYWNTKLGARWVEISEEVEEDLDDPDDFREISLVTINSIWDKLPFEEQRFLCLHAREVLENFEEYLDK